MMAVTAYLDENADPSVDEARMAISSNLCRCTGYKKIVDAVMEAAKLISVGEASS
jgi:carbon-monoxide dehydrogenase small subunit